MTNPPDPDELSIPSSVSAINTEVVETVDATPNEELRALVEEWRNMSGKNDQYACAHELEAVIDE